MIDILEKLKDAPTGFKLYSSIFGGCTLYNVAPSTVTVKDCTGTLRTFDCYGRYYAMFGECTLFPSKDQRNWDNFKVKKAYNFKPFNKVIVRDNYEDCWCIDLFSHMSKDMNYFYCLRSRWKQCLPHNEETAKLIGTTNNYYE